MRRLSVTVAFLRLRSYLYKGVTETHTTQNTILKNDPDPPRKVSEHSLNVRRTFASTLFQLISHLLSQQRLLFLFILVQQHNKNLPPCWSNNCRSVVSLSPGPRLYLSCVTPRFAIIRGKEDHFCNRDLTDTQPLNVLVMNDSK